MTQLTAVRTVTCARILLQNVYRTSLLPVGFLNELSDDLVTTVDLLHVVVTSFPHRTFIILGKTLTFGIAENQI